MRKLLVRFARWLAALRNHGTPATQPIAVGEDSFALARREMVADQLVRRGRDITNPRVLDAMAKVPRHEFVPAHLRSHAYEDGPLPIGHGQTISQPYVVAFMTEHLAPEPDDRVLEIGTGSAYQTAILAELVAQVFTVEIVPELAQWATANLRRLGYTNVQLRLGSGWHGWPEAAPFDAIIVTCAPDDVPQTLITQLKDSGRMVVPVGKRCEQDVVVLRKHRGKLEQRAVLPVRFVPMVGSRAKEVER